MNKIRICINRPPCAPDRRRLEVLDMYAGYILDWNIDLEGRDLHTIRFRKPQITLYIL
jgi:hypothetical protein